MARPKPGQPVRGSNTGRPIMALLDLLGRRWTLRIVWELRNEALVFNELQRRCDAMSSSVLSQRLGELASADIVHLTDAKAYALTDEGQQLLHALSPLRAWAQRWADREKPDE
jgi:DNA-binding HxlR family transcriptional regulator